MHAYCVWEFIMTRYSAVTLGLQQRYCYKQQKVSKSLVQSQCIYSRSSLSEWPIALAEAVNFGKCLTYESSHAGLVDYIYSCRWTYLLTFACELICWPDTMSGCSETGICALNILSTHNIIESVRWHCIKIAYIIIFKCLNRKLASEIIVRGIQSFQCKMLKWPTSRGQNACKKRLIGHAVYVPAPQVFSPVYVEATVSRADAVSHCQSLGLQLLTINSESRQDDVEAALVATGEWIDWLFGWLIFIVRLIYRDVHRIQVNCLLRGCTCNKKKLYCGTYIHSTRFCTYAIQDGCKSTSCLWQEHVMVREEHCGYYTEHIMDHYMAVSFLIHLEEALSSSFGWSMGLKLAYMCVFQHPELSGCITTLTVRNGGCKLLCSNGHLDRSRWCSRCTFFAPLVSRFLIKGHLTQQNEALTSYLSWSMNLYTWVCSRCTLQHVWCPGELLVVVW